MNDCRETIAKKGKKLLQKKVMIINNTTNKQKKIWCESTAT